MDKTVIWHELSESHAQPFLTHLFAGDDRPCRLCGREAASTEEYRVMIAPRVQESFIVCRACATILQTDLVSLPPAQ